MAIKLLVTNMIHHNGIFFYKTHNMPYNAHGCLICLASFIARFQMFDKYKVEDVSFIPKSKQSTVFKKI